MPSPSPEQRVVSVRKYGCGKVTILARGDPRFHAVARDAFSRSIRVEISLDLKALASALRAAGVPDDAARELLAGARVDDEVYLSLVGPH